MMTASDGVLRLVGRLGWFLQQEGGWESEGGGGAERADGGREEGEDRLREKERVDTNMSLSGRSVRVFAVCTRRLGKNIKFCYSSS